MKKLFLTASLMMCLVVVNGQTTTPTEREQNNSQRPERTSVNEINRSREQQASRSTVYYIAMDVTQTSDDRNIRFTLEQGKSPEAPKKFAADQATLNRLASGKLAISHELDLINHLSVMGWEMVSIVGIINTKDLDVRHSKIYFKKSFAE